MELTNLFVVYDPTQEDQPALARAANIARALGVQVHLFSCIHADLGKNLDKAEEVQRLIAQEQQKLEAMTAALSEEGIAVSLEVEWDKDWVQAAVRASIRCGPDVVLKSSYKHSKGARILNKTSDWILMRECLCPVLLVKEGEGAGYCRVLAAVDICARKESYERLNEKVISFGQRVGDKQGSEVHYINAFQDFKGVPDRQELVKNWGIEEDKIHIKMGEPDKVIVAQALKLDVSLVVVGNSARSGLSAAFMGNTVEKVLDKLECDVLSMP